MPLNLRVSANRGRLFPPHKPGRGFRAGMRRTAAAVDGPLVTLGARCEPYKARLPATSRPNATVVFTLSALDPPGSPPTAGSERRSPRVSIAWFSIRACRFVWRNNAVPDAEQASCYLIKRMSISILKATMVLLKTLIVLNTKSVPPGKFIHGLGASRPLAVAEPQGRRRGAVSPPLTGTMTLFFNVISKQRRFVGNDVCFTNNNVILCQFGEMTYICEMT